jgi:hypothetical protein
MSSSQAIGDIFDAIPRGGCIVVARPDMVALHSEAATRNAQLNGECYAVEEREYRGKDYALIRRAEAWQLAELKNLDAKYIVIYGREN